MVCVLFDGVVIEVGIEVGQFVVIGIEVVCFIDIGDIWVEVNVFLCFIVGFQLDQMIYG